MTGKHSFDMFTHNKAVIVTDLGFEAVQGVRYPPYSDNKSKLLDLVAVRYEPAPCDHESMRNVQLITCPAHS